MRRSLSIVICSWNRSGMLCDTLASVFACDYPQDWSVEIVVVDNASTDDTAIRLADLQKDRAFTIVHEPTPGLSHARNRGARTASGEWLLFLDDDVLLSKEYLLEFCSALESHTEMDFWAAPVVPVFDHVTPPWIDEIIQAHPWCYSALDLGGEVRPLGPTQYPFGANMSVRRQLALSSPFSPAYGYSHGSAIPGEETDFFGRLRQGGARGGWLPRSGVRHRMPSERANLRYLMARALGQGRADRRMVSAAGHSSRWVVRELFTCILAFPLAALRGGTRSVSHAVRISRATGHVLEWLVRPTAVSAR